MRSREFQVLAPHLIAVGLLLALTWFVWQPISGDIALWSPAFGSFLVAAVALIAGGCFAWWRFGSVRSLVVADAAALVPMAVVALGVVFIPVVATAAVFLVVGIVRARRIGPAPFGRSLFAAGAVNPFLLLVAAIPVAILWWYGLVESLFRFIGPFIEYGLPDTVLGAVLGLAILLWLDGRPGPLLGCGLAFVYFEIRALAAASTFGASDPGFVLVSLLTLVSGAVSVLLAVRVLRLRPPVGRAASLAVAAGTMVAFVAAPLVAPLGLIAALALERPSGSTSGLGAVEPNLA